MQDWGTRKRLFVYDWQRPGPLESFAPLADLPYSLFLDSNREGHNLSRYSYILWSPFETIEATGTSVTVESGGVKSTYAADPFRVVRERLALWGENIRTREDLPPFQGGAAGYFGYDLARTIEKLPTQSAPHNHPDLCFGLYDKVIAFDHAQDRAYLLIHAEKEEEALHEKNAIEKILLLKRACSFLPVDLQWRTQRTADEFKSDIARVVEYIYAGDIFQANLSRRFTADLPDDFDPFAHYAHLRDVNTAPYGAYMNFGFVKISSCSPERFLEVRGKSIETRPIKGTNINDRALAESEKDRAENIMIVDLLRNDLSKVCEDHSVVVDTLCSIEGFEGLYHLVSVIHGKLRGDVGPLEALKACFPGGSITGAPKIRAMEIIDEMEPHRRGAYCGAIGYIGFDGTMDMAITIRTLVYEGNKVHLQTGGGITAKSDPQTELEETLTKAEKIFESFLPAKMRKSA